MSEWIRCTSVAGDCIFVNMDHVIALRRTGNETRVAFADASADDVSVSEAPEDLIDMLEVQRRTSVGTVRRPQS